MEKVDEREKMKSKMFMDRLLGPWVLEPCLNSILHSMKHIIIYYIKKRKVTESFSSVQFSCSVMSESLQHHGLQHSRLLSPSPTLVLISLNITELEKE